MARPRDNGALRDPLVHSLDSDLKTVTYSAVAWGILRLEYESPEVLVLADVLRPTGPPLGSFRAFASSRSLLFSSSSVLAASASQWGMCHPRALLSLLPPELIEEIVIITTLLGDVRAPATLAQTCRAFRSLIYHQVHKHLWREIFLILFDDPRPAHAVRAHGRAPQRLRINPDNKGKGKSKNYLASHDFPWEDEYKMRIWTESFILRRTQPQSTLSGSSSPRDAPPDLPSTDSELYTILQTILRIILTAAPLPYHALATMASHCPPRSPPHPHPIFSPVLIVARTHPTLGHGSLNISWLARVLAHGFPRALMAPLSVFDENDEVDVKKNPVQWDGLLVKLIAQVGLMMPYDRTPHSDHTEVGHDDDDDSDGQVAPESWNLNLNQEATHDLSDVDSDFEPQPESDDLEESDEQSESDVDSDEVFHATVVSATTSQADVRRVARLRVYNMAYLHPSRAFGPFLPLEMHHASSPSPTTQILSSGAVEEEEDQILVGHNPMRLGSPSTAVLPVPPIPPMPDTNTESFLSTVAGAIRSDLDLDGIDFSQLLNDNDDETAGDSDAMAVSQQSSGGITSAPLLTPMPVTNLSSTRRKYSPDIPEPGEQPLHFDWAWIAAARQVIELNLRDLLKRNCHQGVLRALLSLEGLRSCSAPGFPPSAPDPAADLGEGEDGRTFKDGEGWDWAGVEGLWRRCVCWMDYSDLIGNNAKPLAARFVNPALDEVMRIIPFTLRITHYSRAPASWPGRPKIHVAGYSPRDTPGAAGIMTEPEEMQRRLDGTVEMTDSGDVRWTILSFREDGQGKWSTEGVQIGGRGSAMGVIGMWTSAEHELSDPLGPFWAWKVGGTANAST